MAKIFKIEGYYIDANDDYSNEDLGIALNQDYDLISHHIKVTEKDIGEWDDNHPLNYCNCPKSECEKYFKE